ncbi:glucose-dependent insulinotropic receptor-like [Strongylocentrotus purpuratus]|uniref:G-protein coupled receptors family 1 profile domain-containing protein n=1 Tax=Strongylocentrotus purpuratus TaxID=7668 RepID=A0A7M7GFM8_STRPU|nr:glucose-dependent insulinotropic receptor-like [Strongylocentrotus purpuratus]
MSVSTNASVPPVMEPCISDLEATVIAGIVSLLTAIIFISNITVIVVILRTQAKHHSGYIYTLSLAVADIFVGFMCIVHIGIYFADVTSTTWCLWEVFMFISSCSASVSSIICIAFDRYLAITKPILYNTRIRDHTGYAKTTVAVVWILSIVYGSLPLLGWRTFNFVPCRHCWFANILPASFVITLFITQFIIPVVILMFFYGSMLHVSLRQANQIADLAGSFHASSRWEPRKRAVITLSLIMGCFFVTWGPFFATLFTHIITKNQTFKIVIHSYLFILAISNSCLNPLVYAYWNREFRNIFSRWFVQEGRKIRHSLTSRRKTITFISGNYGSRSQTTSTQ